MVFYKKKGDGIMGFFTNLLKSSLTSKCPDGYKVGGVNEDGFVYYEKIEKDDEPGKLSTVEKERIMVQRVTAKDMQQFPEIPYQLNGTIHKKMEKNTHPYAYMELNTFNQDIAKKGLSSINTLLATASRNIPLLKSSFKIDVGKIMFQKYKDGYGYTTLICTPYTFTGKVSKYPVYLSFMTRMDINSYSALGELHYEKDGKIGKGTTTIWRGGTCWSFSFKRSGDTIMLTEAKTNLRPDKYGRATTVYKAK